MLGRTAKRRRQDALHREAERLIVEHDVSGALVYAVRQIYDALGRAKDQARAEELRAAIKTVAGLGGLNTSTRYGQTYGDA